MKNSTLYIRGLIFEARSGWFRRGGVRSGMLRFGRLCYGLPERIPNMSFVHHASTRLCARYPRSGVTVDDLKEAYEAGRYTEKVRTSPTRWKFSVKTYKYLIVAVYDTTVNHVITVLPQDNLDVSVTDRVLPPHLSQAQMRYLDTAVS